VTIPQRAHDLAGSVCYTSIMRMLFATLVWAMALGSASAWAGQNCTCRAEGVEATLGQTVCLRTPAGLRLARCEMVLNNTSWKFLDGPCPQASRADERSLATAMSFAPETPVLR